MERFNHEVLLMQFMCFGSADFNQTSFEWFLSFPIMPHFKIKVG